MNKNLKLIFGILTLVFVFVSCDDDDDTENKNKMFEISIDGQDLFYDLSQEQFVAGFNLQAFSFADEFTSEEDEELIYSLNSAGLTLEGMMFPDSTMRVSNFLLVSEEYGLYYEEGVLDMTLTVHKIDVYDQILDASFGGILTDTIANEEVVISGEIKFGTN